VDTVPSDGADPAFAVALSTGEVAIMNYSSGNGRIIPTTTSPEQFSDDGPVITFPPPAGGVSHPHMALQHGTEIFVPDLVSTRQLIPRSKSSSLAVGWGHNMAAESERRRRGLLHYRLDSPTDG
jgi:hypothetical protein